MRYIHRNPITAGLTEKLNYTWSSHKAYLFDLKKWNWVSREKILKMLSGNKALQKTVYRDFVKEPDNDDFSAIYKKRKLPAMLGSEAFLKLIKDHYFIKKNILRFRNRDYWPLKKIRLCLQFAQNIKYLYLICGYQKEGN